MGHSPHEINDSLNRFYIVVMSTIALELIGFYIALFWLPLGAAVIIFSQLWFNLLAGVQLAPNAVPALIPFGIADRATVLIANSVGLLLLLCWPIARLRTWLAMSLLMLITLFLLIKYGPLIKDCRLFKA